MLTKGEAIEPTATSCWFLTTTPPNTNTPLRSLMRRCDGKFVTQSGRVDPCSVLYETATTKELILLQHNISDAELAEGEMELNSTYGTFPTIAMLRVEDSVAPL
ncbi:hypothetical protein J6590_086215 [Homalodisca vitripennis]|nr:hypothetical protein J6590_086215 [Homalodisca vitripennis]